MAKAPGATQPDVTGGGGTTAADGVSQTGPAVGGTTTGQQQQTQTTGNSGVQKATGAAPAATAAKASESEDGISQCGMEDDEDEWVRWAPPPRPKTTLLTGEEQQKFREHLEKLFSVETLLGKRLAFDTDDTMEVILRTREVLKFEPMLIEDLPFGITVVADLHGQFYDLDRVFRMGAKDGKPGWECNKYLFLGDYVDRGRQSYETVMALYILKCLYPDRIFLLRGNHEFLDTNFKYGFFEEFEDRYEYDETMKQLYFSFNESFTWLSVAAIVGDSYYCAHAGISPAAFTRMQMRGIVKPFYKNSDDILVQDVTWSDPAKGMRGSAFNAERGCSLFFGFDTLCHALWAMEVKVVIRGHTALTEGVECAWNVLFSLFTATDNTGSRNKGAIIEILPTGKLRIRVMEIDERRSLWEARLRGKKGEKDPKTENDPDDCDGNKTGRLTSV